MDKRYFSEKVVKWYENNRRELPWRATKDPYKIWLSEIILQQTRVDQGLPYYQQFVRRFPTIAKLAAASPRQVLRLWQGLGYYTRARNLHACAKVVTKKYGGNFPQSYDELLTLPGIGEYTAAAIASISFGIPVAVVDGNVFRLLSRVIGIDTPINSPKGKREFSALANDLISHDHPHLHNQGVMELGALVCTPKNPKCACCVFSADCFARKNGLQEHLPVKIRSLKNRKRYFYYVVVEKGRSLLMRQRQEKDIWLGLFDFNLIEKSRPLSVQKIMTEEPLKKLIGKTGNVRVSGLYKHILSHQTIFSRFIVVKTRKSGRVMEKNAAFYSFRQIAQLPKPVLVNRFLADEYLL